MTEPNGPPTASDITSEPPTLGAVLLPDDRYGYALPGRRFAQVAVASLVLVLLAHVAAFLPRAQVGGVSWCVSLVPLSAVALVAAVGLAAAGEEPAPLAPLLAGWLVVLGGAACDIVATVTHSPDLSGEANPILRRLLDDGVTLDSVYLFAAVSQLLFVGLTMVLWLGLLKHRHTLAATMPPGGSLLAYFKAGTGGRELSYRQWLLPLIWSELPWAYHFAWWTGVVFIAASAYRFYLALEWYEVAPLEPLWVRFIAPTLLLLVTSWWYAAWLRRTHTSLDPEAIALE